MRKLKARYYALSEDEDQRQFPTSIAFIDGGLPFQDHFPGQGRHSSHYQSVDASDHGLRVAALAAGVSSDVSFGGVSPGSSLYGCPKSVLYTGNLVGALLDLVSDAGGIDVLCLAWSSVPEVKRLEREREAFEELSRRGILVVAAAGHDGSNGVRFPALLPDIIAVGVYSADLTVVEKVSFSPSMTKPLLSVENAHYEAISFGRKFSLSGTSAAAAIISGCLANVRSKLMLCGIRNPAADIAILMQNATRWYGPGYALRPDRISVRDHSVAVLPTMEASEHQFHVKFPSSGRLIISIVFHGPMFPAQGILQNNDAVIEITTWLGIERRVCKQRVFRHEILGEENTFAHLKIRPTVGFAFGAISVNSEFIMSNNIKFITQKKQSFVVGISQSHNSAACIADDARILTAIQLERISRIKHDGAKSLYDTQAIEYCLKSQRVSRDQVGTWGFNLQALLPGWTGLSQPVYRADFDIFDPFSSDAVYLSHHLAHAFAAYVASPFDHAVVMVADGSGGAVAGPDDDLLISGPQLSQYVKTEIQSRPQVDVISIYEFTAHGYKLLHRERADSFNVRAGSSSLGETYASVSNYVFGDWIDGSGKLMGLAPYGDPAKLESFLEMGEDGLSNFGQRWKLEHNRSRGKDVMQHRDLAARVQADIEIALLERASLASRKSTCKNFVFTGGLALNCVANEKLYYAKMFVNYFFFPASNDAGVAIGATAGARFYRDGVVAPKYDKRTYWTEFLGHDYQPDDCYAAMHPYREVIEKNKFDLSDVTGRLLRGEVIGLFQGKSEFGPRALGHRSLIALPRNRKIWTHINQDIKGREDFRPFAPAVLESDASTYFEITDPSPFMLRVVKVRDQYRDLLEAVTHVDGTARVQTITNDSGDTLAYLLQELKRRGLPPILLNTSLNFSGEPIVETPLEAVEFLLMRPVAGMILNDVFVTRKRPDAITSNSIFELGVNVTAQISRTRCGSQLVIKRDRPAEKFEFSAEIGLALTQLDGTRSLREVCSTSGAVYGEALFRIINALEAKGFVLYKGELKHE